jgi:uncharacterized membrane protein YbhN (UPF0104 family)
MRRITRRRAQALGAGGFVVLAIVVAFAIYGRRPARLLLRRLALLPGTSGERTETGAATLVGGFSVCRQPGIAAPATVLTAVSWLLIALSSWLVMRGFALGVGFEAGLLVVVAKNLSMILPSGPPASGSSGRRRSWPSRRSTSTGRSRFRTELSCTSSTRSPSYRPGTSGCTTA